VNANTALSSHLRGPTASLVTQRVTPRLRTITTRRPLARVFNLGGRGRSLPYRLNRSCCVCDVRRTWPVNANTALSSHLRGLTASLVTQRVTLRLRTITTRRPLARVFNLGGRGQSTPYLLSRLCSVCDVRCDVMDRTLFLAFLHQTSYV